MVFLHGAVQIPLSHSMIEDGTESYIWNFYARRNQNQLAETSLPHGGQLSLSSTLLK